MELGQRRSEFRRGAVRGCSDNYLGVDDSGEVQLVNGGQCSGAQERAEFYRTSNGWRAGRERISPHLVIRFQSQNDSTLHIPHEDGLRLVSGMGNFYAIGNQASMHSYFPSDPKDIDLVENKWNYLLLSFEATGPQGRLWLAVNDKNYSGQHLYPASLQHGRCWRRRERHHRHV